jgi:hypothetical protein
VGEDGLKRVRDGSCKPIPLYSYKMDCRLQAHTRPSCSVKGARTLPSHTHTHAHTRTYIQTHTHTHTHTHIHSNSHAHTFKLTYSHTHRARHAKHMHTLISPSFLARRILRQVAAACLGVLNAQRCYRASSSQVLRVRCVAGDGL